MLTRTSGWYNADLAALGFLAAVALVVLWPVTLGNKVLLPADLLLRMEPFRAHAREYDFERVQNPILDPIQQHYPWRKFAAQQVRQDQVPLWNPYMSCGAPFLANNQSAPFYLETWLFYIMAPERAFGWAALLYMLLAGGFMYWYLRTIDCRPQAALLGALPFMLSGFAIGWMAFPTLRSVPAWLPLMLVGHEKTVRGHKGPWWVLSALAVGMSFMAGHLHISFFVLFVFTGYIVFRAIWGHNAKRQWTTVFCGSAALFIGTLIGAAQVLPVVELVRMASRPPHSFEYIKKMALVPASFLTGLMPDIFGNPVDYNYWGEFFITKGRAYLENVWYVGVATLLLAIAVLVFRRTRLVWFWLATVAVGVGIAWGTWLYWVGYQLLPAMRMLPGISRAVVMVDVGLAVLAGLGAEAILRALEEAQKERVVRFAVRAAGIMVSVGLIGGIAVWLFTGGLEQALPGIGGYTLLQIGIFVVLAILSAVLIGLTTRYREVAVALLVVVVAVDLGRCAVHFIPMVPRQYLHIETEALRTIRSRHPRPRIMSLSVEGNWLRRMPPNLPMAFGLECVESSDSLLVPWYEEMMKAARAEDGQPTPDLPLWDALGVDHCLTPRELNGRWRLITEYETNVYFNSDHLPCFMSPKRVVAADDYEQAKELVTSPDYDPVAELIMVGQPGGEQGRGQSGLATAWSPNAVTVEVGDGNRWWVLADTYYPGWHAYAGDRELQIVPANYALRGIYVPPGVDTIRFIYYPASFLLGAFLTALSIGALGFVMGYSRRRRECDADI